MEEGIKLVKERILHLYPDAIIKMAKDETQTGNFKVSLEDEVLHDIKVTKEKINESNIDYISYLLLFPDILITYIIKLFKNQN